MMARKAQRGDRTDAGRRHEGAHLWVIARQLHDFAVEIANLFLDDLARLMRGSMATDRAGSR